MLANQAYGINSKGDDDGVVPSWGLPKRDSMLKKTFKAIGKVKKIKSVATKKKKKMPMELMSSVASLEFESSEGHEEDDGDEEDDLGALVEGYEDEEQANDEELSDQEDATAEDEENVDIDKEDGEFVNDKEDDDNDDNNDNDDGKEQEHGGKSSSAPMRTLVKAPSMAHVGEDRAALQFESTSPVGRKSLVKGPSMAYIGEGNASPGTPSSKTSKGVALQFDRSAITEEEETRASPVRQNEPAPVVTPSPRRMFSLPVIGGASRSPKPGSKGAALDDSAGVEAKVGQNEQTFGRLSQTFGSGSGMDGYFSKIKELKQKLPPSAETWNTKKETASSEAKDGNPSSVVLTLTDGEDPSLASTISIDLVSDMKLKSANGKSNDIISEDSATTSKKEKSSVPAGNAAAAESTFLSPKRISKMFRRDKEKKAKDEGSKLSPAKESRKDHVSSHTPPTENDISQSTAKNDPANQSAPNDTSTDVEDADHDLHDGIPDGRPASARELSDAGHLDSSSGQMQRAHPVSARNVSDSSSGNSTKPRSARQLTSSSSNGSVKRPSGSRHASAEDPPSDQSRRHSPREVDDESEELTPLQPTSLRDIRRMVEASKGADIDGHGPVLPELPVTPSSQPRGSTRRTSRRLQRKTALVDLKSPKLDDSGGHPQSPRDMTDRSNRHGRNHNNDTHGQGTGRSRRSVHMSDSAVAETHIPDESEAEAGHQEKPSSLRNLEEGSDDTARTNHRNRRSSRNGEQQSRSHRLNDKRLSDRHLSATSIPEAGIPEDSEKEAETQEKPASSRNLQDGTEETPQSSHRSRRSSRSVKQPSESSSTWQRNRRGPRRGSQNNEIAGQTSQKTPPPTKSPPPTTQKTSTMRGLGSRSASLRNFYGGSEGKSHNLLLETFGAKEIGDDRLNHSDSEMDTRSVKDAADNDAPAKSVGEKDLVERATATDEPNNGEGENGITPFVTRRARPSYKRNARVVSDNKSAAGDSSRNPRSNRRTHPDEESPASGVSNRRMHSEGELVSPRAHKHRVHSREEITSPRANSNRRMNSEGNLGSAGGSSRRHSRQSGGRKKHAHRSQNVDSQAASEVPHEGGKEHVDVETGIVEEATHEIVEEETKEVAEHAQTPEKSNTSDDEHKEKCDAETPSGERPNEEKEIEAETPPGERPKEEKVTKVEKSAETPPLHMKPPKGRSPRLGATLKMGAMKKGHQQMDDQSVLSDIFGSVASDSSAQIFKPGMSFQIHSAEELNAPQLMFNPKENDEGMDVQVANQHVDTI